jgi:phage tail-like protein
MATTAQSVNNRGSIETDPIRNFRFLVTFKNISATQPGWMSKQATMGFTSVSGLNISTESIPYREGQHNTTVQQIPGQTTFSPITFQRGVAIGSDRHWDWMRMLFRAANPSANQISAKSSFRCDIDINVLGHPVPYAVGSTSGYGAGLDPTTQAADDPVVLRFRVFNAWPTSVAYSDLNAGDNALVVEQLTVVHEGFNLQWGSLDANGNFVAPGDGAN